MLRLLLRLQRSGSLTLALFVAMSAFAQPTTPAPKTLRNLQAAYNAESAESELYAKFAHKADIEGYGVVASLFRAIARAEEIHASYKATLITELGGTPERRETPPHLVRSTPDNLRDASEDEAYESDILYDGFAKHAKREHQLAAMRMFRLESATEPKHRALFKQALLHLADYEGPNTPIPVCPHCGFAARALKTDTCPICNTPAELFEWIK
jgi:rubrerythrin